MKTFFQKPHNIFMEAIKNQLYTGTDYQYCGGGYPDQILKTTYQQVIQHYNKLFTFSNCHIYSYGDLNFTENLFYLNENYLKDSKQE